MEGGDFSAVAALAAGNGGTQIWDNVPVKGVPYFLRPNILEFNCCDSSFCIFQGILMPFLK